MRPLALVTAATLVLVGPAHADCLGDIKDVVSRSMTSGPYSMSVDTADMKMTSNVVPPASFHSTMEMEGMSQEMIIVDGKAWSNMAGQGWTAMPGAVAAQVTSTVLNAVAMADQITAPECLGMQSVDGRDLLAFKYDMSMMGVDSANTLYVDPGTKLPAIMQTTATIGGQTTETKASYRYDPAITISPPAM
jgi:hypothetical protein